MPRSTSSLKAFYDHIRYQVNHSTNREPAKEVKSMEIRNYSTDVAIIGGGGAALRAAIEASEKGQNVILVDKGRPGRFGKSTVPLIINGFVRSFLSYQN